MKLWHTKASILEKRKDSNKQLQIPLQEARKRRANKAKNEQKKGHNKDHSRNLKNKTLKNGKDYQ